LALPAQGLVLYWRFDRSYCDEVSYLHGGASFSPPEEEMALVQRLPSGADVELMSVSWACLAECPPHPALVHGTVTPNGPTHEGETIALSCDGQYQLQCEDGSSSCATSTCQNDGTNAGVFEPEVAASCVGICGNYPVVPNGDVTPSGTVFVGEQVEITCKDGYQLNDEGNSPASCYDSGSGGAFDKMAAACVAVCEAYPAVEHGSVSNDGPTVQGEEVEIVCDPGYEIVESPRSGPIATCIDAGLANGGGAYDKPAAECRARCSPYPAIPHGQASPDGPVWVGADVAIACKYGYVLTADSASTATCVEGDGGGVYDNVNAVCEAVCAPFPEVEHATISPSGEVRAGDTVHVVCDTFLRMAPRPSRQPAWMVVSAASLTNRLRNVCQPPSIAPGRVLRMLTSAQTQTWWRAAP